MLQNAASLRKSAPWPPNISDEHVSCTAPATRNASFQILFKCPTPKRHLKKKTMFFSTASKNTVNYRSFSRGGRHGVGRRQGAQRLQLSVTTEGLRQGHGLALGRRPAADLWNQSSIAARGRRASSRRNNSDTPSSSFRAQRAVEARKRLRNTIQLEVSPGSAGRLSVPNVAFRTL